MARDSDHVADEGQGGSFSVVATYEPARVKAAQRTPRFLNMRKARAGRRCRRTSLNKPVVAPEAPSWPDARARLPYGIRTKRESFGARRAYENMLGPAGTHAVASLNRRAEISG